jgi:hypothetical protein
VCKELDSPELNFRIDQIEDPFQNTFKWIFDVPEFSDWLQEGSELFWIRGKPGSGQSTLMKFIYRSMETWEILHNWRTTSQEIKAGFFFHYRGTAIQKSFEGVLRSLITQILALHYDALRKKHSPLWEDYQSLNEERENIILKELNSGDFFKVKMEIRSQKHGLSQPQGAVLEDGQLGSDAWLTENDHNLEQWEIDHHTEKRQFKAEIARIDDLIKSLAARYLPSQAAPETKLITNIIADFNDKIDERIYKLENILHRPLDQDVMKMDLVLFIDALDEVDGNLNLTSRFLKARVKRSPTSATRVKVCFNSRPWEALKDHFSSYPGSKLQDYTRHDIAEYAAGSLASSVVADLRIIQLIPDIISRANGVFLWLKLALRELFDTASLGLEVASLQLLEEKLRMLPIDLFDFYKLIIDRNSKHNRRRTFALLELLSRLGGASGTAAEIRDAVLTSGCTTFEESQEELLKTYTGELTAVDLI